MARPHTLKGFHTMDPELQRAIASNGGVAAQEKGTAHKWNHEEALAAGRKGGQAHRLSAAARRAKRLIQ